jgi:hypothetical protein
VSDTGGAHGSHEVIQIGPSEPPSRWLRAFVAGAVLIVSAVVWLVVRDGSSDVDASSDESYRVSVGVPAGPHLLGVTADWELFARGRDELVRIELATGRVTRTSVPELGSSGGIRSDDRPVAFIVGPDRVVVRPINYADGLQGVDGDLALVGYQVVDGGLPRALPPVLGAGTRGLTLPGPRPGTAWVPNPLGTILRLVRLSGDPTDISIRLPGGSNAWIPIPDGSGYVLDSPSGVRRARSDGVTRISSGTLMATGPTGWLVRKCDRGRCANVVIDRRLGTRRVLPGPPLPGFFTGVIAPDGSTAAMFDRQSPSNSTMSELRKTTITLLDLRTGERRSVPVWVRVALAGDTVAWSPNSRWLFVPRMRGGLAVLDTVTGELNDFKVPLPRIEQLAVRTR